MGPKIASIGRINLPIIPFWHAIPTFFLVNNELIKPLLQISRKDADQFEPGRWIPECQLIVEWEREDQRAVRLRHKVDLIGAQAPYDFFYLTLNPGIGLYLYGNRQPMFYLGMSTISVNLSNADVETLHSSRTRMPSHSHLEDSLCTVGVRG